MAETEKILLDALTKIYKWNLPVGADRMCLLFLFSSMREAAGDAISDFYNAQRKAKEAG